MAMHTKPQRRTDGLLNPDRRTLLKCSAWAGAGASVQTALASTKPQPPES
ncbi:MULTISPECIES: hypothetical protein [Pseudomonas]|nr:hypothetical protein [Pseudomonas sp. OVF7]WLD65450.1 hypothetical protein QU606_24265 [Pseudomonas sp. OVF7]